MMYYSYSHPDTKEVVEILQEINDVHEYVSEDGTKYDRVFNSNICPAGLAVDPFSSKQFLEKTSGKGTLGDVWDRAKEMSAMRAEKRGGVDEIADKAEKDYLSKRCVSKVPKKLSDVSVHL